MDLCCRLFFAVVIDVVTEFTTEIFQLSELLLTLL